MNFDYREDRVILGDGGGLIYVDSLKQGCQTDPGATVGPCHLLRMSVSVFSFFFFLP